MTHKERVLELLRDGKPHGHMEGYRLGVMLHSRVADLRRDGHKIECWRDGDNYLYRLLGETAGGERTVPSPAAVSPSCPDTPRDDGKPNDGDGQLSLVIPRSTYEQERAA